MKLTRREKSLMSVLGILLLFCGLFFLGYLPLETQINSNLSILEDKRAMHDRMNFQLKRYGTQDETIRQLQAETDTALEYIMPAMSNSEIDQMLRSMAADLQITVTELSIADVQLLPMDQYPLDESIYLSYPIKDYLQALNQATTSVEMQSSQGVVYLLKNSASISYSGSFSQLEVMIDAIREMHTTIYVEESYANYDKTDKQWNIQIVVGIYTIEDVK